MTDTPPIIIVLGPQGSGKGTQIDLLVKEYGMSSVAAGDLFRAAAKEPTDIGRRAKAVLDAGDIMSIDLWEAVVGSYLERADLSRGFFLDGLLRSMEQVESFEKLLASRSLPEPYVLSIVLDDKTATGRLLKRGRHDDQPEQIRARLAWSRSQAQPVIDYYRPTGRLIEVDGNDTIEAVHAKIVTELTKAHVLPERSK